MFRILRNNPSMFRIIQNNSGMFRSMFCILRNYLATQTENLNNVFPPPEAVIRIAVFVNSSPV